MHSKSLEKIAELFLGKVVTIMLPDSNRDFNEKQSIDYFVCRIIEVTSDGLLGIHPLNGTFSYYKFDYIMSIHQEMELDPNNPDHMKLLEEMEKMSNGPGDVHPMSIKPKETPNNEPAFVDIKGLENLAKTSKEFYNTGVDPRQARISREKNEGCGGGCSN